MRSVATWPLASESALPLPSLNCSSAAPKVSIGAAKAPTRLLKSPDSTLVSVAALTGVMRNRTEPVARLPLLLCNELAGTLIWPAVPGTATVPPVAAFRLPLTARLTMRACTSVVVPPRSAITRTASACESTVKRTLARTTGARLLKLKDPVLSVMAVAAPSATATPAIGCPVAESTVRPVTEPTPMTLNCADA